MNPTDASFIVLFPEFSYEDRRSIKNIRKKYDTLCGKIEPHITLLFPQSLCCPEELAEIVATDFATEQKITIVFDRMFLVHEDDGSYLFLSTTDNAVLEKLRAWHQALYSHNNLINTLKNPDSYKGHMTVGRFSTREAAENACAELLPQFKPVRTTLSAISVVWRKDGQRTIHSQYDLGH
ncbi:MAG: 2'-5' RNA ligase family protein [Pseudomonadota bacterium]|nr:2'-5' RNA ligase family protein [Pseudomonadota bacterium]